MADMGTDNYEQEFTLGLVEKDRQLLREINTPWPRSRTAPTASAKAPASRSAKPRLGGQAVGQVFHRIHQEDGKPDDGEQIIQDGDPPRDTNFCPRITRINTNGDELRDLFLFVRFVQFVDNSFS